MPKKKALLIGLGLAALFYLMIVPMSWHWLPPTATAAIAEAWPHGEDMAIPVQVSCCHPNFVVRQIRLYPKPQTTTAHGPAGTLYPIELYSGPVKRRWGWFDINRLTFPRKQRITVTLPLSRMQRDGSIMRGTIDGELQIEVEYVASFGRETAIMGAQPRTAHIAIPVRLRLE